VKGILVLQERGDDVVITYEKPKGGVSDLGTIVGAKVERVMYGKGRLVVDFEIKRE
jgi:hypothetical protein